MTKVRVQKRRTRKSILSLQGRRIQRVALAARSVARYCCRVLFDRSGWRLFIASNALAPEGAGHTCKGAPPLDFRNDTHSAEEAAAPYELTP